MIWYVVVRVKLHQTLLLCIWSLNFFSI